METLDLIRAEELITLYHCRWADEPLRPLAVEQEYRAPLTNPETGAASRTFQRAGKLDALVQDEAGRVWVLEHKTSSEDISPGSDYFDRLQIDGQISHYMAGARALGFDPAGCIYDVIGKPQHEPLVATPVELRKYTIEKRDKKTGEVTEPSRLYAAQRAEDETPDAYRERLREALLDEPDRYLRRATVVRLEEDMRDAAYDDWQTARAIRDAELAGRWPRNPDACMRFGRKCDYWSACTRTSSLDEMPIAPTHSELSDTGRQLPMLTASSAKTFRACARQYRNRYIKGRVSPQRSGALSFGTLMHVGLEAWWRAVGDERLGAAIAALRQHEQQRLQEAA